MPKIFNPEHKNKLDSASRMQLIPPEDTLRKLGLKENMKMADIGCGTGFFTLAASKIVGKSGTVFAADIEPLMLQTVSERICSSDFPENIHIVHIGKSLAIEDKSCDFILMAFVLHEAESPIKLVEQVSSILKEGGTLALIDWDKVSGNKSGEKRQGPAQKERISLSEAKKLLLQCGFSQFSEENISANIYTLRATKRG